MTRRPGRRRSSRGAALLELALVAPFLLTLLFGIGEFGLAWVSGNRLESAVSTAARTGSSSGSLADADRNILLALRAAMPDELSDNVERIVVYRSDKDGTIAPACLTNTPQVGVSSGAHPCNVYSGSTLQSVTASTDLGTADDYWPATARQDHLSLLPDYVGVLVQTRHDAITGTFWDDFDLERSSVYRIAPDIDG